MFGLFKRKKLHTWEIDLMRSVLSHLPEKGDLLNQVNSGLIIGVKPVSNQDQFIWFKLDMNLYAQLAKSPINSCYIKGASVYSQRLDNYVPLKIHLAFGIISGYSFDGHSPELIKLQIDSLRIHDLVVVCHELMTKELKEKLSSLSKTVLSKLEVFEIELEQKKYIHLFNIGDGDFIGANEDEELFVFLHDPFLITPMGNDWRGKVIELVAE